MALPRIRSAQLFALDIPFRLEVAHARHTRSSCDSVILRLETSDGVVGFGEAVPRPYVTGETVAGVLDGLARHFEQTLHGAEIPAWTGETATALEAVEELLPCPTPEAGIVAHNSARAALEVALLDCMMRAAGLSITALLPSCHESVIYSGLLPTVGPGPTVALAKRQLEYGITRLKVKVGDPGEVERVKILRELLGPEFELYVDANCSWSPDEALARIEKLAEFNISLVEQPVPRGPAEQLAELRNRSPVPIMVDESLVTLEDARQLVEAGACDLFNVRISKCGGLGNCLELVRIAERAGLDYQLGAHVGETAILSAAGRHLALSLGTPRFVEGSVGGFLLTEDLTTKPVQFEHGGTGTALFGTGLGIEIEDQRLRSLSVQHRALGASS